MSAIRVRVPATSANLGPGFDTLGIALQLYNYVTIEASFDASDDRATAEGEGSAGLAEGSDNIAVFAARSLLLQLGAPAGAFHLHLENHIPLARGLGSSAAARAGALVAANEWARAQGWKTAQMPELVALASKLEGHPDNVAAALLGGLVVSAVTGSAANGSAVTGHEPAVAIKFPVPQYPRFAVFIPATELATKTARGVLPDAVLRADAVFNISHTALLLAALANGSWQLLPEALLDRMHQDHRAALMPAFRAVVRAATEAGAHGATLSGAGPTVLAWIPHDDKIAAEIPRAMEEAAAEQEVQGRALVLEVDLQGTEVVAG